MKATITHPSWSQIDKACAVIAGKVSRMSAFSEDKSKAAVVGLARGGLVPAVIISHLLGLKMFPVSYSSKQGNGEYKQYENVLPNLKEQGFYHLLIVDDIVDTGHTMKEIVDHYYDNHGVTAVSLYYKEGSVYRPAISWQDIPYSAPWIEFPWEL